MKIKTDDEADVNIAALIDCLMQCIIFFMTIMAANYIFGVAIKFPTGGGGKGSGQETKEKNIVVFVQSDAIEKDHQLVQDGILKINGEEIALTSSEDPKKWVAERERGYQYLEFKIGEYIKQGYKKDVLIIQGDMTTYHYKVMSVIDRGKANGIKGFSLIPPS